MIKNYLVIALRSFLKHKSFTLLNVIGLSLGMVASLLILQYVKYERSYDAFNNQAADIYRVNYAQYQNGKLRFDCAAAVPASAQLRIASSIDRTSLPASNAASIARSRRSGLQPYGLGSGSTSWV